MLRTWGDYRDCRARSCLGRCADIRRRPRAPPQRTRLARRFPASLGALLAERSCKSSQPCGSRSPWRASRPLHPVPVLPVISDLDLIDMRAGWIEPDPKDEVVRPFRHVCLSRWQAPPRLRPRGDDQRRRKKTAARRNISQKTELKGPAAPGRSRNWISSDPSSRARRPRFRREGAERRKLPVVRSPCRPWEPGNRRRWANLPPYPCERDLGDPSAC